MAKCEWMKYVLRVLNFILIKEFVFLRLIRLFYSWKKKEIEKSLLTYKVYSSLLMFSLHFEINSCCL